MDHLSNLFMEHKEHLDQQLNQIEQKFQTKLKDKPATLSQTPTSAQELGSLKEQMSRLQSERTNDQSQYKTKLEQQIQAADKKIDELFRSVCTARQRLLTFDQEIDKI